MCICPAVPGPPGVGSPGKGGSACCREGRKAGRGQEPLLWHPSKAAAAPVGGRGPAGPHPLISLSALRSWQELPSALCWWLDLEGVQATWLPLAWGAGAMGVQGLTDPHPPLCVPLLTTQHPQGGEPKQVGSECRLGTSLVDRVRLHEWQTVWTDSGQEGCLTVCSVAVQGCDCGEGMCLSV